jgi:hypothetical protein
LSILTNIWRISRKNPSGLPQNNYKYVKVKTMSGACNITVKRALIKAASTHSQLVLGQAQNFGFWRIGLQGNFAGVFGLMPGWVSGLTRGFYVSG